MIEDFTIDGKKNETFPKLPMKKEHYSEVAYEYFGVYHKKFLYYLSNNIDASVIRHEIDKGSKSHMEIPGSKIPNNHLLGMYNVVKLLGSNVIALSGKCTCVKCDNSHFIFLSMIGSVQGVRLGNLFWVLGGFKSNSLAWDTWIPQEKTSIWTIKKEKWIQGPKIPLFLVKNGIMFCATAINSTFVMFIGMQDSVFTYDFTTETWSNIQISWKISCSACNTLHDKQAKT